MALPSLPRDGRVVVPAIHRFAWIENKPRVAAQGSGTGNTFELQNSLLITTGNKGPTSAPDSYTRRLRPIRVRRRSVARNKKAQGARLARAAWRSFGEYASLEDSRYASQLKSAARRIIWLWAGAG
jgi:hypothetical protein